MSDKNIFRIIVIDDNPSIHYDFIKILKTESSSELDLLSSELFGNNKEKTELPQFEIDVASQGQEGVERIKEAIAQKRPYALAFVDIRMPPGWDGIETIKHIWELDQDIQIVICTAYSDYSWEETVAHLGKKDNLLILKKPFDNTSVRQLACALTTKWKLAEDSKNYTDNLQKQIQDRTLSLEKSLALVKSTFESSSDGILVINNEGVIIDYNSKLINMLQIPAEILYSKQEKDFINFLKSQITKPEEFEHNLKQIHTHPEMIRIDVIKFKNGRVFDCYSQPHKLNDKIIGYILDFRDITKRALLEQELQYQATHDPLTGLENRVQLIEKIKQAIKTTNLSNTPFAILFIDFDRFKLVNDSLSHETGDELLIIAADRLKKAIRTEDSLARIGGDEFVIVMMNVNNNQDIECKVKQIIEIFQNPFILGDRKITLTASVGISIYPKDGETVTTLLRNADTAMYRAKSLKGNIFQFYDAKMSKESIDRLDQEMELRQAIQNEEFFLCYQPQVDIASEKLVAVEALIRWNHQKKGIILPIDFIPVAEETGLITEIGKWVLYAACKQNKIWQDEGFAPIRVAVNITAQQFKQDNLVETVKKVLKETKLNPKYLELELTENVILSNREVIRIVSELKEVGVIIAIDDFGTGYSSLSYLHKIPLDRLKIDSSFIQHIHSANDDEVIIRAVIAMAKNLNLEVLAEGVETSTQLNFLKKYQCNDVQGFYFSKPLTSTEVENYLKNPELNRIIPSTSTEKK